MERTTEPLIAFYSTRALLLAEHNNDSARHSSSHPVRSTQEETMRHFVPTLLLALCIATLASAASAARQDRYCLQGRQWGFPGTCHFSTLDQCRATASGTGAHCAINPRYAFARQRQGTHRSQP
jgi:hypothetical protein